MYNHHDHWTLFFFLDNIVDDREDYNRIKNNEQERATSKTLGKRAVKNNINYFIVTAILTVCAVLTYIFFSGIIAGWWKGIITLIVALACLPLTVVYFILALNCDIKQMKLNKLPIGWVSLLFTLLILVASIAAVVITILVI